MERDSLKGKYIEAIHEDDNSCCDVCFNKYTPTDDTKPLVLSCGHTFCYNCLRQIWYRCKIKCPSCRKETYCNSMDNIPVNYLALTLINEINIMNRRRKESRMESNTKHTQDHQAKKRN